MRYLNRTKAIGENTANNTFDSSNVVANENGSALERLEGLKEDKFYITEQLRTRIDFGAESPANAAASYDTVMLVVYESDAYDLIAMVYADDAGSDEGKIRVGKVVNDKVTSWGTEKEFEAGASTLINAIMVDKTATAPTGCIFYVDGGDSNKGKLIAFSVNTTTMVVTIGTAAVITSADVTGNGQRLGLCLASSGKVVCYYRDEDHATDNAEATAVTITGTTVGTPGTAKQINSAASTCCACVAHDDDGITFAYVDSGGLNIKCCDLSGTTFGTAGSEVVLTTNACTAVAIVSPDTDKVIVGYQDGTASGDPMYLGMALVNDTAPVMGTLQKMTSTATTSIDRQVINTHQIAAAYTRGGVAIGRIFTIVEGVFYGEYDTEWADEYTFNSAASLTNSCAVFNNGKRVVFGCEDDGGSDHGICFVGVLSMANVGRMKSIESDLVCLQSDLKSMQSYLKNVASRVAVLH